MLGPASRPPNAATANAIGFFAGRAKADQGTAIDNSHMKPANPRNTTSGGILSSRKWFLSMCLILLQSLVKKSDSKTESLIYKTPIYWSSFFLTTEGHIDVSYLFRFGIF